MHVLLPARRGRAAHGVQRDLRGPAAVRGPVPLRRRPRHRRGVGRRRARPLRGAAGPAAGPPRSRRHRRRAARGDQRRLDHGRPALARLPAGQAVPRRAAAAPGVPHDADGLVRAAALTGGRPAHRDRARRGGRGQPVRRHRRAAHPHRVPRGAVHRGRPRAGPPGPADTRRDALVHARRDPRSAPRRVRRRGRRVHRRRARRPVPAAGHRQVRGSLRHPHRLRGPRPGHRAPARGARVLARRRRRSRDARQRPVRRGVGQADAGLRRDLPRVARPARRATRSPTPAARAPASTCSTGTARAAPTASSHRRANRIPPPAPRAPAEGGDGS